MRTFPYHHVDVFTDRVLEGNPLAVFTEPGDLSNAEMQAIALEMNLAETVFIFPPVSSGSLAQLRIFTPRRELAFAGHPTIGAVAMLLAMRGDAHEHFTVDEGVGPVPIRVERLPSGQNRIWLTTPPVTFGAEVARDRAAQMLGIAESDVYADAVPRYASAGSPFLFIPLRDVDAVDRASFAVGTLPAPECPDVVGVFFFTPRHTLDAAPHAVYSRMFAPWSGISEDPATGGATGPLAAYMLRERMLNASEDLSLISEQGTQMGRRSFLHVRVTHVDGTSPSIEVGGSIAPFSVGTVTLP